MSSLKNRVFLLGNVGQDPRIKIFDKNNKIAIFSLATNESYTNYKAEKIIDTQWHNIVAKGKLAEIVHKYVIKGKELAVEGKLTYRTYDDAEGNKKHITEIVASEILLLGNKY